jgi:hypothetical protein
MLPMLQYTIFGWINVKKIKNKAFVDSRIFTYILAAIILLLIILLSIKWITDLGARERMSRDVIVDEKMKSVTETLLYGAVKKATFDVPLGSKVCFFDPSPEKRNWAIENNVPIIKEYPSIKESITGEISRNIVYLDLKKKEIIKTRWLPDICFDKQPYYECIDPIETSLEVFFEGRGKCVAVRQKWTTISLESKKNLSKYSSNISFLAWDKDDIHTNWPSMLSLVPIALWSSGSNAYKYPYTIFYNSTSLNSGGMIKIINSTGTHYGLIMSPSPVPAGKLGTSDYYLNYLGIADYFSFWSNYSYVVISPLSNKSIALKAALTASAINAPIIYISDSNKDNYADYLNHTYVWLFDNSSIQTSAFSKIKEKAEAITYIGSKDIPTTEIIDILNLPQIQLFSIMGGINE